jgi:hypothetical protein
MGATMKKRKNQVTYQKKKIYIENKARIKKNQRKKKGEDKDF